MEQQMEQQTEKQHYQPVNLDKTKTLKENVDLFLLVNDLSLKALADEIGVKYSTLYNITKSRPLPSTYKKLGGLMSVDPVDLFNLAINQSDLILSYINNLSLMERVANELTELVESFKSVDVKRVEIDHSHPYKYIDYANGQEVELSDEDASLYYDISDEELAGLNVRRIERY